MSTPSIPSNQSRSSNTAIAKRLGQIGVLIAVQALVLFTLAGRWDWAEGWVYMVLYLGLIAANAAILLPHDTGLIAERAEAKEDAKGWDRRLGNLLTLFGISVLIVAALDERFGWSPPLAPPLQWAAAAVIALAYGFFAWAMASNRFFSAVVRIQKDRGHTVVSSGPYQIVRHPAYASMIVSSVAIALLLGSLWAFVPDALLIAVIVARTALEDRTLKQELDGYKDYAADVRYRLLPGVW